MQHYKRPLEDLAIVTLTQNGTVIKTGNIYDVREVIETMVEEKLGVFVSLQEYFDTEEKTYELCVHSDAFEDLEEEEVDIFLIAGLSECSEETTPVLRKMLGIDVIFSHYIED